LFAVALGDSSGLLLQKKIALRCISKMKLVKIPVLGIGPFRGPLKGIVKKVTAT